MPRLPENLTRAGRIAAGAGAWAALALTLRRWAFDTAALDAVYYAVHPARVPTPWWPFVLAALAAFALTAARRRAEKTGTQLLPAWLLWILLALPATFPNLAAVLGVTGWCLLRSAGGRIPLRPLPRAAVWGAVALTALTAAAWSYFLQQRALRAMFLAWQDWGEYTACYLRLADGGAPLRAYLMQAGHFDPLPNLVMSALLKLWRAPEAVFAASALLSGATVALTAHLAEAYRMPRGTVFAAAFAAALSPVLVNQSLSLFYGFHPVLFQGPLILAFFIFERRKCRIGMAAAMLLSLAVQETAAVLYFGYALYLLSRRRWRAGALLGAGCVAYFVLVSTVVMPFASGGGAGNPQLFHYSRLGNSLFEVALSPLLRPRAFWGTLAERQNLYFALALLLPAGALALRAPRRLLIALPLLAGVAMQSSPDVKNPAMQYGFEISVVLLGAAVAGAGKLLRRRGENGKRAFRAGWRTVAALTLLCALAWGRMPCGLYSARPILNAAPKTGITEFLRGCSRPGERVLTTRRLQLYHMFDRRAETLDAGFRPGDTVILDFDDTMEPVDKALRRLLDDARAVPLFPLEYAPAAFAVWKIAPDGTRRPPWPFLRRFDAETFRRIGLAVDQNDPAFEARLARMPNGKWLLLLRLAEKVDCDFLIELRLNQNGRETRHTASFGHLHPAWYASIGDTYLWELPETPQSLRLALVRRK